MLFTHFLQVVGVMSALPGRVPSTLHSAWGYQASSNEWIYSGNKLLHNETATAFPRLPSLDDLTPGESVGLFIDNKGSLHIFFNGTFSGIIATGLPTNKRLWGVASVEDNCCKIKSEMLSGKLDAECVCLYLVHIL